MKFLEYELRSEAICLGERIKKGTVRPTVKTIPYSQITGALRATFGKQNLHATGVIVNEPSKQFLTFSPKDNIKGVSKIPITVEFLTNVVGRVYVVENEDSRVIPSELTIFLGAMRSKGLGETRLAKLGVIDLSEREARQEMIIKGVLATRIPMEQLPTFEVKPIRPRYGYLFKPTSLSTGQYVLSLFEGSDVSGPRFLLRR